MKPAKKLSVIYIISILLALITIPALAANYTIRNNGVYGISIDISKSPYSDAWGNGNPYGPQGCTWFAASRVEELTGINMGGTIWGCEQWYNSYWKNWKDRGFSAGTTLDRQHKSLICWQTHIAVIEGFTSDGKIILSEGGNTSYPGNGYCTIDVYDNENALKSRHSFLGYVYLPVAAYGSNNLRGYFDEISSDSPNTIHVRGWAIDDDTPNKTVDIHVYVGGPASPSVHCYPIQANVYRTDGGIGWHGFDATINVAPTGTQDVYVYAIDTAGNGFLHLSNSPKQVTIKSKEATPNLRGFFDEVNSESPGTIHVRGWAIDDDTPNQAVDIHVYVGGPADPSVPCYPIQANDYRTDGGIGWHGFDATINVTPTGTQDVYVYAIDTAGSGFLHLSNSPKQVTIMMATPTPTQEPTSTPTLEPTAVPTLKPTIAPTIEPTNEPTVEPTVEPTIVPDKVSITNCQITVKDLTYTGKVLKPKVTVKYGKTTLKEGTHYTLSYSKKIKAIGPWTVTVKGKGKYTGSKKLSFNVIPKGTAFTNLTGGKQQITLKWKNPKNITGYQIEYSLKKDFSGGKKVTIKKAKTLTTTIKNLKAEKTYYVHIRTYTTVKKKNYYSAWSAAKTVKTKGTGKKTNEPEEQVFEITMNAGEEVDLKAMLVDGEAVEKWTTDNPEIADVSPEGVATAVQPGKAVVTAIYADGSKIAFAISVDIGEIELIGIGEEGIAEIEDFIDDEIVGEMELEVG